MSKTTATGMILAAILLFGLATAGADVRPEKFSFRISAGYGRAGFGDLNKAEEGHNARFEDLARLWGFDKTGELALPHKGPDFSAEIVLRIARRLEVGLGFGLVSRMNRASEIAIRQSSSGALLKQRWGASASAAPLTLNAYFRVPLSTRLSGLLMAGLGCYFSSYRLESFRQSELLGIQTWSRTSSRGRDYAVGPLFGLALEFGISRALFFFAEGDWRFVSLKRWSVEYIYSSSSMTDVPRAAYAWSAEELDRDTGAAYPVFVYSDQEPAGPYYQNVRKARIDLSGPSLRAGIRFRLGT